MRLVLAALFALAGASAASAQVVQDRYGPPRRQAPAPASGRTMTMASLGAGAYDGRLLGWAGKAAPTPHPLQPAELARPAEAAARGAAPFTPAFTPQPMPQPARAAAWPQAPERPVAQRPVPERPVQVATRSAAPFTPAFDPPVRAQPAPAPAAQRAAPTQAEAPAHPAGPQPAPARTAYALAGGPPDEQAPAPAAPPRVGSAPRFYSLHREYGRTPDAIPPQASAPRYVLIGPPDAPDAKASSDHGDEDEAPSSHGQF
jgi:hypothetical protein